MPAFAARCGVAFLLALVLFAVLLAPGAAPAREPPKEIGHLWLVSRPNVPDSYVFGTIHVTDPRVATPPAAVRDALSRSRTLAVEMVPDSADPRTVEFESVESGAPLSTCWRCCGPTGGR